MLEEEVLEGSDSLLSEDELSETGEEGSSEEAGLGEIEGSSEEVGTNMEDEGTEEELPWFFASKQDESSKLTDKTKVKRRNFFIVFRKRDNDTRIRFESKVSRSSFLWMKLMVNFPYEMFCLRDGERSAPLIGASRGDLQQKMRLRHDL